MATGNVITSESLMIVFIFTATLLFYPILEVLRHYLKFGHWPTILILAKMGINDRDLAIKLMASVAGWMTGAYYAKQWGFDDLTTTLFIAVCDATAVGIANLANELPRCRNLAAIKSLLLSTLGLMLIVAGAAAIWEQMSLSAFPENIVLKALFNGILISAEFYIPYKLFLLAKNALATSSKRLTV